MAKKKTITLRHSDLVYLLELLDDQNERGSYWGHQKQFWTRHDRVKATLEIALNTKTEK